MIPTISISLKTDFTKAPGGRYRKQGPHSGEQFREEILKPALEQAETVVVDLNGVYGLPASFLDEAIGFLAHFVQSGRLKYQLSDNKVALDFLQLSLKNHAA